MLLSPRIAAAIALVAFPAGVWFSVKQLRQPKTEMPVAASENGDHKLFAEMFDVSSGGPMFHDP